MLTAPRLSGLGNWRQPALRLLIAACLIAVSASVILVPSTPAALHVPDAGRQILSFIPNAGQTDPSVRYQAEAPGSTIFFTDREVVLALSPLSTPEAEPNILRISFDGASAQTTLTGASQLPGVVNYIQGNDSSQWQLGLPTYGALNYQEIYPGITLRYEGSAGNLKSTYEVARGANPSQIVWRYQGATNLRIDSATGNLLLDLPGSETPIVERAPIAWQDFGGERHAVPIAYRLTGDGGIAFTLGSYNPLLPLTIDPTLEFSTYLGGLGTDQINDIAVDPATGIVYVTGVTSSATFPGSPTVIGSSTTPTAFVAAIAADGSATVYRTLIGGSLSDSASGIAVEGGVVTAVGTTASNNFPTTPSGVDTTYGSSNDIFAFQLDAAGTLLYGTYLGGTSADTAEDVAVSGATLYIAGWTQGSVPGESAGPFGGTDALVYRIDTATAGAAGQIYARRIGGLFTDEAHAIALDTAQNVYVTGRTFSTAATPPGFPTAAAYQATSGGGSDAFIVRLNAGVSATIGYSTYLGGTNTDEGLGIAVAPAGNMVYVTGNTDSTDFPTPFGTPGTPAGQDAFLFNINISTNSVVYNRLLGSPGEDSGNGLALDNSGAAYVAGSTDSTSFFSLNPLVEMSGGGGAGDGFVTRYDVFGNPSYSTRVGGTTNDVATGVATVQTPQGAKVYVAGYTSSGDFPMTTPPTAIQPTIGGGVDGFVVRISNLRPIVDLNDNNPGNGIDFGPTTWTEAGGAVPGSGPVAIISTTGLTVIDTDNPTLSHAEVRFVDPAGSADGTAAVPPDGAAESLSVTLSGGVTGNYVPATGILRLTGGTTLADYQAVLRTLTYDNSLGTPTAGTRRIVVEASDGIDLNMPFAIATVNVVATNDPPVLTVPATAVVLSEETAGAVAGISVADGDLGAGNIEVAFSVPAGTGTLTAAASGGATVTGSGTASLTISGTLIDVNATLATVQFTGVTDFNTNSGGADAPVTLTVTANDQGNTPAPPQTDSETVNITVNPVNDPPVVPGAGTVTTTENAPLTLNIAIDLGVSDAKDTAVPAAPGAASFPPVTSITVTTPPANGSISGINPTTGSFIYTPNTNYSGPDSFTYSVCDLGTPLPTACSSQTVNVTVSLINDEPSFTGGGNVTSPEDIVYSQPWATNISAGANEGAQTLTFVVTNNTNPALFSAGPAIAANGTLSFTPTANTSGSADITVELRDNGGTTPGDDTSAPVTFIITITPVNDPPTATTDTVAVNEDSSANPIDVLANDSSLPETGETLSVTAITQPINGTATLVGNAITYTPNPDFDQADSFTYTLSDGNGGTATGTVNITITPINDAPVLDNTGTMILASISENDTTNAGTLVSTIIASAGGDRITDVDTGAVEGIAVIAADTTNGIWEFSTNNGTSWTPFGTLSATSATLLSADATTRIRFAPNANFNGQVDPGITFRAWDRSTGTNGATGVDPTPGGGTTAFSTATETASISVAGVNQAPVLDNTGVLSFTAIDEDIAPASNQGTLVSAILASAGGDPISDVDTGAVDGIAVIGTVVTNGSWEFSVDGGTNWTDFGTPSQQSAVLLAADANTRIRFLPALNFNGTINPGIAFRAWDQTTGANGATLVDTSTNGGQSSFSSATETALIVVNSVNDLPQAVDDLTHVAKDTTANPIDVLANDISAPDVGETLTVAAVTQPAHGTVQITGGGTAVAYTPTPGYEGTDTFTYTLSDGNGGSDTATVNIQVGRYYIFLPLVLGEPLGPDLEIVDFSLSPSKTTYTEFEPVQVSVTVRNNGTLPAGGFWVDFFINPSVIPNRANIRWEDTCSMIPCQGIAWYVQSGLQGGQSITLTSTIDSYYALNTRWGGGFNAGTTDLYVYVDSWNGGVLYGAVEERNEENNSAAINDLTVNPRASSSSFTPQTFDPVPPRPLRPDIASPREER